MNKREVAVASTCFASVVIRCALPPKAPSTLGFDQTTCSLHKVYCLNHTLSSHNSALLSQKHLNRPAMSFLCYLERVFIASLSTNGWSLRSRRRPSVTRAIAGSARLNVGRYPYCTARVSG